MSTRREVPSLSVKLMVIWGGKRSLSGSTGGSKTAGVPDSFVLPFDCFRRTGRMLVSFSVEGRRGFSHEGGYIRR